MLQKLVAIEHDENLECARNIMSEGESAGLTHEEIDAKLKSENLPSIEEVGKITVSNMTKAWKLGGASSQ
ncbi:MAG: hypothetical protein J6M18_05810 [Actinomycetaceae bacterium]|nr:hypothetical protein [Actinomycetaceae bacterium]